MDFKDWKIKVFFEEVKFDSPTDERRDKIMMEHTLEVLLRAHNFLPRQGDIIGDMDGDLEPFVVEAVAVLIHYKTIEFYLGPDEEEE